MGTAFKIFLLGIGIAALATVFGRQKVPHPAAAAADDTGAQPAG